MRHHPENSLQITVDVYTDPDVVEIQMTTYDVQQGVIRDFRTMTRKDYLKQFDDMLFEVGAKIKSQSVDKPIKKKQEGI